MLLRSDVGEVEKEVEESFKCWDAQPPPSPPSPSQTLLLTAPGCRLSCLPIGYQPPPSDQWEGCWSELRGEAQQRQGPDAPLLTSALLNPAHLELLHLPRVKIGLS